MIAAESALPAWLRGIPYGMLAAVCALAGFGVVVLYSAAGGELRPWALNHGARFLVLLGAALLIARLDMELWIRHAYLLYAVVLVALIGVEALGFVSGGSQRWLDLGFLRIQPSEFMKPAVVLALARYYHRLPRAEIGRFAAHVLPLVGIALPAALVILQPDLGTAMMITAGGLAVLFLAGLPMGWFLGAGATVAAAIPLLISQLHEYQRKRVLTFLNPESDPLGSGYHITQSKIAIGSGGLFGKGFLEGTQSRLDYLPELHTDFVFATMAEEWGVIGGLFILGCYGVILGWGMAIALSARSVFARLAAGGLVMTIFFYVAINLLMVMGLAPVVGIPLPLVSYGGSAMMTVMVVIGLLISISRGRDREHVGGLAAGIPAY